MAEGVDPKLEQFPQTTVECEGCGVEFDVRWFCKNCPASLCDACKEKHSKDRLMKKHEVVPRTGSVLWSHGSWKVNEPCKKHKNKDLITYCNECKVACCIACMAEKHKCHDWTDLEKAYFNAESRLNTFVNKLSKTSLPQIQNEISSLKQKVDSCNQSFENVHLELNTAENKWTHFVSQSFKMLHLDLKEKQSNSESKIQEKIEDSEGQVKKIENLISITEGKIRAGGLHLIDYYPTDPLLQICHSDLNVPMPQFILNEEALNKSEFEFGELIYESRKEISSNETAELILGFEIAIFGGRIESVDENTAWVCCHEDEIMYCYDREGKVIRSVSVTESEGIRDFVIMNNRDIIVSCVDKKIRSIPMYGNITVLTDAMSYTPRGMCLTDTQEIVVCMTDDNGTKSHLAVFSSDGKTTVRKVRPKDENNKKFDFFPFRVDFIKERNATGQIIVIDNMSRLISIDSQTGKIFWIYDGSQVKPKNTKFNPVRVCKDKLSNLLVTDSYNDCIHFIDKKGNLIRVIMVGDFGLQEPWGIGMDHQSGRIWCGSRVSKNALIMRLTK